ncbi:MAG: CvpA family protein [Pseudomonadota bacterium]
MTAFDWLVIAAVLVSGLLALVRGLSREISSILSILAAFFSALWGLQFLEQATAGAISESALNYGLAAAALFLFGYVAAALIFGRILAQIGVEEPGPIDRGLGFIFGGARGLVIVGLIYAIHSYLQPVARHAYWITEAKLYPIVHSTSKAIASLAPQQWDTDDLGLGGDEEDEEPTVEAPEPTPPAIEDAPTEPEASGQGYGRNDRASLERLLSTETTNDEDE